MPTHRMYEQHNIHKPVNQTKCGGGGTSIGDLYNVKRELRGPQKGKRWLHAAEIICAATVALDTELFPRQAPG